MVAERDGRLLQREARIASLENTIADLEGMLRGREATIREREAVTQTEIARREATIRDREERIAWLEGRIRRLETPSLPPRTDNLPDRLSEMLARLPGWCPEEKARWMVEEIIANGYQTAAELGVFAGRSVFPIALAIASNQGRAVYAIDAWENTVATADPGDAQNHRWWDSVDLVAIKSAFLGEMIAQNLVGLIRILELSSAEACAALSGQLGRSIDFLHIDGAHSEAKALYDVTHWSPLVAFGGMIVLDDIDWPGVRGAAAFLAEHFEPIKELRGEKFAFAAFRVT
jgi:predicted O-methyltransferase YrrM